MSSRCFPECLWLFRTSWFLQLITELEKFSNTIQVTKFWFWMTQFIDICQRFQSLQILQMWFRGLQRPVKCQKSTDWNNQWPPPSPSETSESHLFLLESAWISSATKWYASFCYFFPVIWTSFMLQQDDNKKAVWFLVIKLKRPWPTITDVGYLESFHMTHINTVFFWKTCFFNINFLECNRNNHNFHDTVSCFPSVSWLSYVHYESMEDFSFPSCFRHI